MTKIMTRRIFITIEYDGAPFVGWQRQDNGDSVQAVIETAAEAFIGDPTPIAGAGRTDSGVHATGQVAHLDVPDRFDANQVMQALNAHLVEVPVTIHHAHEVPPTTHARFSATCRRYLYRILPQRQRPALNRGRVWHHHQPLDSDSMHKAAQCLVGKHDFTSFRAVKCQADSPVRTLNKLDVEQVGDEIHIHAEARSFLHHQVRNIAGTLALVGVKKWDVFDLRDALAACDRAAAGPTAPPWGLYLVGVDYADLKQGTALHGK